MAAKDGATPPASRGSPGRARSATDAGAGRVPNILVVEDEFLLACMIEEDLRAGGCTVVGPFGDLASASEAAGREAFDLALLDINLNGEMAYPLADDLQARGIPFLFLSGYGTSNLPERFRTSPQIAKPYDPAVLLREIERSVRKAR